ncbi:MAG: hypothetical protein ACXADC_09915 [Candidatus Thorarchaeota archaeon]|jgi:hypothetical protein
MAVSKAKGAAQLMWVGPGLWRAVQTLRIASKWALWNVTHKSLGGGAASVILPTLGCAHLILFEIKVLLR